MHGPEKLKMLEFGRLDKDYVNSLINVPCLAPIHLQAFLNVMRFVQDIVLYFTEKNVEPKWLF